MNNPRETSPLHCSNEQAEEFSSPRFESPVRVRYDLPWFIFLHFCLFVLLFHYWAVLHIESGNSTLWVPAVTWLRKFIPHYGWSAIASLPKHFWIRWCTRTHMWGTVSVPFFFTYRWGINILEWTIPKLCLNVGSVVTAMSEIGVLLFKHLKK